MIAIDLNCDLGEGMDNDAMLMKYISAANIACGGHAGDTDTIKRTIESALENNVAVGAHPSYIDRANFGRIDWMEKGLSKDQFKKDLEQQFNLFVKICEGFGITPAHIKPHGALYNRMAWDMDMARLVYSTIAQLPFKPLVYGLSGSAQQTIAVECGLAYVHEVFADRTYQDNGSLTPRTSPGALIESGEASLEQVLQITRLQQVSSLNGKKIALKADSVCIHGDGAHAVEFAALISSGLEREGVKISRPLKRDS